VTSWRLHGSDAPSLGAEWKRPTLSEFRDQVIEIVKMKGHLRLAEPVQLASGAWSRDFVDTKHALEDGDDLATACRALLELVSDMKIDFDAIGGLTLGADKFSYVTSVFAHRKSFVVRKVAKGRGTNKRIEGADLSIGVKVLLVDDVVTSGGSIRDAYEAIHETGATIVGAITLVDRGDTAAAFFAGKQIPYRALVTYGDLGIEPVGGGLVKA
jgi:orotate phosphoribosyltransferase